MADKTILIIDDEQGLIEPLEDALAFQRDRVRKAATVEAALKILQDEHIDLATVDIMLPAGPSLEKDVPSQQAGLYLLEQIARRFPQLPVLCMSVVSDKGTIHRVRELGVRFIRKGDTPLRTVLEAIEEAINEAEDAYRTPRRTRTRKLKGWD